MLSVNSDVNCLSDLEYVKGFSKGRISPQILIVIKLKSQTSFRFYLQEYQSFNS